ncbi:MAG: AraC family transcriptional regulator [Betaproteobacteria bacterium]|nr:AraC family transcriptional regulator [Betaproteobacteria bacterium]
MQKNSVLTDSDAEILHKAASPGGVVPGGYSRVSVILAMVPLLDQFGVGLDGVLRESGLPADQFDDPENLIPFREGGRLIGLCADRTGCAHLGLMLGKGATLESFGIVADLVKSAADVRSGLRLLGRYLTLSDGGGLATFSEDGQIAELSYALYEPGIERPEFIYDLSLCGLMNIMQSLCGLHWRPDEVLFSRRRPHDLKPYRDFFSAPLRFDAEHTALVFKREWLDAPLTTSDPAGLLALEAQARDMEARSTGDLLAQIRRIVRRQLLSGSTSSAKVADELAVHPRTMARRLVAHQTAFRSLVDEVRYDVSQQLLTTHLPILAIAQCLQYANPAAFTRAFRRWSGAPPLRWRARLVVPREVV